MSFYIFKGKHVIPIALFSMLLFFFLKRAVDEHNNRKNSPQNVDDLKLEIIAHLKNPFPDVDTVILGTEWNLLKCGNSDGGPLPVVLDFDFQEEEQLQQFSAQLHQTVVSAYKFFEIFNERAMNPTVPRESIEDYIGNNKAVLTLKAEKITASKIKTYEDYEFNGRVVHVGKSFYFKERKWHCRVMKSGRTF